MLLELVTAKGGHAGLDASCAQSDEDEAHHGERAEEENSSTSTQSGLRQDCGALHLVHLDSAYM